MRGALALLANPAPAFAAHAACRLPRRVIAGCMNEVDDTPAVPATLTCSRGCRSNEPIMRGRTICKACYRSDERAAYAARTHAERTSARAAEAAAIESLLDRCDSALTSAAIAEQLGLEPKHVAGLCGHLAAEGRIEKVGPIERRQAALWRRLAASAEAAP